VHPLCQRRPLSELSTLALRRRPCRCGSQAASTVLMLGLARTLTLRVSSGSNTLSSSTQTQRSCYIRIAVGTQLFELTRLVLDAVWSTGACIDRSRSSLILTMQPEAGRSRERRFRATCLVKDRTAPTLIMLARALTLRTSHRTATLSSYTQTQRPSYTHLGV
jgi:hypothetical protein